MGFYELLYAFFSFLTVFFSCRQEKLSFKTISRFLLEIEIVLNDNFSCLQENFSCRQEKNTVRKEKNAYNSS